MVASKRAAAAGGRSPEGKTGGKGRGAKGGNPYRVGIQAGKQASRKDVSVMNMMDAESDYALSTPNGQYQSSKKFVLTDPVSSHSLVGSVRKSASQAHAHGSSKFESGSERTDLN